MSFTFLLRAGEESSAECFSDIPASVLSKLSPTDGKRYSPGNRTELSHGSQSGMTSEHSMGDHGAGASMSCAADSPAKTLASREQVPESTESEADYGAKWQEWFAKWDHATYSWKIPQLSLFEDSDAFSPTWPRWGTMRNGVCYPLPMPSGLMELRASIISVSASGSSRTPTPTSSMMTLGDLEQARFSGSDPERPTYEQAKRMPTCHGFSRDGKSNGPSSNELGRAVNRMQTPVKDDAVNRKAGKINSRGEPKLSAQVLRVPTVTKQDSENDGGPSQYERNTVPLNALVKRMPTAAKSDATRGGSEITENMTGQSLIQEVGGSLNPDWTEWLMGFPIGWTALAPLGTHSFRKWLLSHGGF